MLAIHKIITPDCHTAQGSPENAVVMAIQEAKLAALDAVKGYGNKANIHIKVEIERLT